MNGGIKCSGGWGDPLPPVKENTSLPSIRRSEKIMILLIQVSRVDSINKPNNDNSRIRLMA